MRSSWFLMTCTAVLLASTVIGCEPPPTSIPPGNTQTLAPPVHEKPIPPPPARPRYDEDAGALGEDTATDPGTGTGTAGPASGGAGTGTGTGTAGPASGGAGTGTGTAGPASGGAGTGTGAAGPARGGLGTGKGSAGPAKKTGQPDGASCSAASECQSGVCEGEGCGVGQGVCAAQGRMCTRDLRPYCGCDGKTFRSSGSCPGKRFQYRGECRD